jgi:hypothetical protein
VKGKKMKLIIDAEHRKAVDALIPEATKQAVLACSEPDKAGRIGTKHQDWPVRFMKKMDALTIAAGLRVPMDKLFEMKERRISGNGK